MAVLCVVLCDLLASNGRDLPQTFFGWAADFLRSNWWNVVVVSFLFFSSPKFHFIRECLAYRNSRTKSTCNQDAPNSRNQRNLILIIRWWRSPFYRLFFFLYSLRMPQAFLASVSLLPLHFLHLSTLLTKKRTVQALDDRRLFFLFPPTDGRRRVATSAKGTSNYRKPENNRNQTRAQRWRRRPPTESHRLFFPADDKEILLKQKRDAGWNDNMLCWFTTKMFLLILIAHSRSSFA